MRKLFLISPEKGKVIPNFINLIELSSCPSTNDHINDRLDSFIDSAPLLVSAGTQTMGRGRDGRRWFSAGRGGLYISYLLKIKNKKGLGFLSIAAGAAIAEAVKKIATIEIDLKWPNDIELSGLKVGGILIENQIFKNSSITVAGIGLNVNNKYKELDDELSGTATSLSVFSGKTVQIDKIKKSITEFFLYFIELLDNDEYKKVLKTYSGYLKHKADDKIVFNNAGKVVNGIFRRIDGNGGIVLLLSDGTEKTFFSGEISNVL